MEMTKTKMRTRAELLMAIESAKLELEALNRWKKGDQVMARGTVEGYADDLGTVLVNVHNSEIQLQLDEDSLEPGFDQEPALQELADRCKSIIGENSPEVSSLAAIDAVIKLAEHLANSPAAATIENGNGNGSVSHSAATGTPLYVVVRRDTSKPATQFDLAGREFFNGYHTKAECEAYRKECEDRESCWGVRGGVYGVMCYTMIPAPEQ